MIILITASNLFQLFVGWEGVGICSYLLINFWFHRIQANKAALMAVMTNKIGDIALLAGFCILLYNFKTLDYGLLFSLATDNLFELNDLTITNISQDEQINNILNETIFTYKNYVYITCLLFIIGAIGKSAQLGLHIWLPEAMEDQRQYHH
jgi:NADH:ubiquinone oxidoreductase subunit 5 (subunit L)/multisubunit Na+/H+ antiporter MnhA subunit